MKTVEEIINAAKKSEPIDSTYELLDIHFYIVINLLYKEYSEAYLSENAGLRLKQIAINKYIKESEVYNFQKNIYKKSIEAIRKTEKLRIALRKAINNKDFEKSFDIAMQLIQLYSSEFKDCNKLKIGGDKIE